VTRALVSVYFVLLSLFVLAGAAAAESDHLACVSVKDNTQAIKEAVPSGKIPVEISNVVEDSFADCEVKVKLTSVCIRVEKNNGDDDRGDQAGAEAYGCYKIKCREGQADGSMFIDDQFVARSVERKKLVQLCTPIELNSVIP